MSVEAGVMAMEDDAAATSVVFLLGGSIVLILLSQEGPPLVLAYFRTLTDPVSHRCMYEVLIGTSRVWSEDALRVEIRQVL